MISIVKGFVIYSVCLLVVEHRQIKIVIFSIMLRFCYFGVHLLVFHLLLFSGFRPIRREVRIPGCFQDFVIRFMILMVKGFIGFFISSV